MEYGKNIILERTEFIKQLNPVFNKYYTEISDSKEVVNLEYKSQLNDDDFSKLISLSREKDRISKTTQVGIHKDDLLFQMNNYPIKKTGSQGQQKTFLIALKLAQFEFIKEQAGFKPILLLDDVLAELDTKRQLLLLDAVGKKHQCLISATHLESFEGKWRKNSQLMQLDSFC